MQLCNKPPPDDRRQIHVIKKQVKLYFVELFGSTHCTTASYFLKHRVLHLIRSGGIKKNGAWLLSPVTGFVFQRLEFDPRGGASVQLPLRLLEFSMLNSY